MQKKNLRRQNLDYLLEPAGQRCHLVMASGGVTSRWRQAVSPRDGVSSRMNKTKQNTRAMNTKSTINTSHHRRGTPRRRGGELNTLGQGDDRSPPRTARRSEHRGKLLQERTAHLGIQ